MKNRVYHEKQGLSEKNRVYLKKKQGLSEKNRVYLRKTGFIREKQQAAVSDKKEHKVELSSRTHDPGFSVEKVSITDTQSTLTS